MKLGSGEGERFQAPRTLKARQAFKCWDANLEARKAVQSSSLDFYSKACKAPNALKAPRELPTTSQRFNDSNAQKLRSRESEKVPGPYDP